MIATIATRYKEFNKYFFIIDSFKNSKFLFVKKKLQASWLRRENHKMNRKLHEVNDLIERIPHNLLPVPVCILYDVCIVGGHIHKWHNKKFIIALFGLSYSSFPQTFAGNTP